MSRGLVAAVSNACFPWELPTIATAFRVTLDTALDTRMGRCLRVITAQWHCRQLGTTNLPAGAWPKFRNFGRTASATRHIMPSCSAYVPSLAAARVL